MDKVVKILEKNVQWIALGLAGLWLFYVAWFFGVQHPVTVPIGRDDLPPGDADPVVRKLSEEVNRKLTERPKVTIAVPNYMKEFEVGLKGIRFEQPLFAGVNSMPQRFPPPGSGPVNPGTPTGPMDKVAKLPEIPEPTQGDLNGGKSFVQMPVAAADVNFSVTPIIN